MDNPFTFGAPLAAALNHLLDAEPTLRARLAPFAGEVLEVRAAPLPPLCFALAEEGRLAPAPGAASASLVITLLPGALAAAARGEDHFLRAVEITGNAQLASEVMFLLRHLRWDAEEDLARALGDVAAQRVAGAVRSIAALQVEAAQRIATGFMEYALEERPLLATRRDLQALASVSARLRDDLERLQKRIERLELR